MVETKLIARPWTPQDLLDDLQDIINEEPDNYLNTRRTTLEMALDYLKEHFYGWIPVSERLPEREELVLIICKNGARFVGFYNCFHDGISWGIKTALNSVRWLNKGRVTHWMPLPEPPQED